MGTILIAEDCGVMKEIVQFNLEKQGHTIVGWAKDGSEAIELYKKHRPELFLTDIMMPKIDGKEAIRSIKKFDSNSQIIACSAVGTQDIRDELKKLGVKDFILKPFPLKDLLEKIEKAFDYY